MDIPPPPPRRHKILLTEPVWWHPIKHEDARLQGQLTPLGVLACLDHWLLRHGPAIRQIEAEIGHPFKAWAVQQIRACLVREQPTEFAKMARANDPRGVARDPGGHPCTLAQALKYRKGTYSYDHDDGFN